ncbi:IS110 family transposase, partial [Trujillonella humicola]|uniref:IS110 family transposase n=1 Tax=Trujillonella humicola TaxID=3383699 RepID=UPI00390600B0
QTHCAVAVDEGGRQLGKPMTVRATDAGHRQLLRWAGREFADTVAFAVEDCRHVSMRLERALLDAGAAVVRVPPKLMALTRTSARTRGKSDPIDALAIARAAVREPDLPRAEHTHASRELKLLVDHREDLVGIRTGLQNRLRWRLHELDPEFDLPARGLDLAKQLDRAQSRLEQLPASTIRRIALEELADIRDLTGRINGLEKEITALVRAQAPQLLSLPGCGPLTAAKLVAETANPARFRSEACFAMHAGAAPIPASSGKTNRHRLARGGNRQLNAALHRIAVTQIRLDGLGRAYYQRRRATGDTTMEALRALKRRLARIVFNLLRPTDTAAGTCLPAAA